MLLFRQIFSINFITSMTSAKDNIKDYISISCGISMKDFSHCLAELSRDECALEHTQASETLLRAQSDSVIAGNSDLYRLSYKKYMDDVRAIVLNGRYRIATAKKEENPFQCGIVLLRP